MAFSKIQSYLLSDPDDYHLIIVTADEGYRNTFIQIDIHKYRTTWCFIIRISTISSFKQEKFDSSFDEYGEDDLPRLEKELEEILIRFDDCTIEKHKLSGQIKEHTALVDTTVSLFEK